MVIPEHLFEAVNKIQDTILICPPVISQYAAAGAMAAGADYCRRYVEQLADVRRLVIDRLRSIGDRAVAPPADGAFYFFLRLHTESKPLALVERLVREFSVAAIPGNAFGMEDGCYLRIAYGALQKETVAEGIGRLTRGIEALV
jgi:aspartate/methionine/tyrosine aminotransferase